MSLTLQKRAEIFDRIRDGKKVRFNWLTVVCQITAAEVLELADEFKLIIEDEHISMPKDPVLVEKIETEIELAEKMELIEYLKQPSYLENELPVDAIEQIEERFNSEGFVYKRHDRKEKATDVLKITKKGIEVIRNNNLVLCNVTWEDMKDMHLTTSTELDYTIKKDLKTEFLSRVLSNLYTERYITRADFHKMYMKLPAPAEGLENMKVKEEIKTINTALISFHNRESLLINTIDFKSTKRLPFVKEYDSLIYIIEHFFHTIKRKEYDLEQV